MLRSRVSRTRPLVLRWSAFSTVKQEHKLTSVQQSHSSLTCTRERTEIDKSRSTRQPKLPRWYVLSSFDFAYVLTTYSPRRGHRRTMLRHLYDTSTMNCQGPANSSTGIINWDHVKDDDEKPDYKRDTNRDAVPWSQSTMYPGQDMDVARGDHVSCRHADFFEGARLTTFDSVGRLDRLVMKARYFLQLPEDGADAECGTWPLARPSKLRFTERRARMQGQFRRASTKPFVCFVRARHQSSYAVKTRPARDKARSW